MPESAPVVVDAQGNPPPPPPPAGSYAAQAMERQLQRTRGQFQQRAEDPPSEDGLGQPTPQSVAEPLTPRAEQRIQDLVAQLRVKEQELQTAMEMGRKATETATQFQSRLTQLETQHQQMLHANLENLDPDTRAQVLMDARMQQSMGEMEQRIMGRIAPELQTLRSAAAQHEMHTLSQKYPGFNYQVHAPLIDQFRARNSHCSIEQAFRAVAEPEELAPRQAARAQAVPPFVPPGNGDVGSARYVPPGVVRPQAKPEDELVEESRRIKELRASTDPAKQKEGLQLLDQHLKRRLGG